VAVSPQSRPVIIRGRSAGLGEPGGPVTVTLEADGFSAAAGEAPPWMAAYRDIGSIRAESGAVHLVIGTGPGARRLTFDQLGPAAGSLVRGLRDGRVRQWLTDGLVRLDGDTPAELVEFTADGLSGVASLLYHGRGVALVPVDELQPRLNIRRAEIGAVSADPARGRVQVAGAAGPLGRGRVAPGNTDQDEVALDTLELCGLGALTERHRQRWTALRDAAAADVATILGTRLADAPFETRRRAAAALREGRPADAATLGDAASAVETAVLADPMFAASYRTLVARGGGDPAARWIAMAPIRPGQPDDARIWFLVGLPGNLLALELVSSGAHATYLFRVAPRAAFKGGPADPAALAAAVREISEALIDSRFLREPMALPPDRLAEPRYLRYRLAIAALPSLAAARGRFVARLVHADPNSWAAGLDDLIAWHGSERDDAAVWPGRAAMEAQIEATQAPDEDAAPD
jgi:hypothetical protein